MLSPAWAWRCGRSHPIHLATTDTLGAPHHHPRLPAMKLLRYGPAGREQPGVLDAQGNIRALSGRCTDIGPEQLGAASLRSLAAIDPASLPLVPGKPRLGLPFSGTRKFIAIGLNYADHAEESKMPIPSEPVIFTKAVSCLQGP